MIRICEARSGKIVAQDATGAFLVHDQRVYAVRSESRLADTSSFLTIQPLSEDKLATLCFDNYVGLAEIAGLRFRVQHSKLTEAAFTKLLDRVVAEVADLAFDYGSPTALPFEREDLTTSPEVLYHALAYLRHVMLRAEHRLLGQFLQIARHPHRRMEHEARWMPVGRATSVGPGGLLAVASHPERLVPVANGSKLAQTGLGRQLGRRRPLFPAEVLVADRTETFDTHENRLVLHVLRLASDVIAAFEGRKLTNPDLGVDLRVMREEIDWMLSFDFLGEVGPMQLVPSQSSVLQRREGYREFLGHFIRLSQSSILAEDRHRWEALLDLKDCALLYEMWCFFEVKRTLEAMLGRPERAEFVESRDTARRVKRNAAVFYSAGQIELLYNATYSARRESYSVTLRPDVVLRVKRGSEWEALILDAKLKFEGAQMDELGDPERPEEQPPKDRERTVKKEDLYKMHTYRDAIREAVGAFVLYPGSKPATYLEEPGSAPWCGIGAIPLDPGTPSDHLRQMLSDFLSAPPA